MDKAIAKFLIISPPKKSKENKTNNVVSDVIRVRPNVLLRDLLMTCSLFNFLLALKVSLAKETEGVTLIFDEIDRGIGGATAESVGERLSILSKTEQILLITHSPQVAAKANKHWKVSKKITDDGFPISFTRELDENNNCLLYTSPSPRDRG